MPLRMTVTDEDAHPRTPTRCGFSSPRRTVTSARHQTATNAAGTGLYDTLVDITSDPYVGQPACTCGALSRRTIAGEVTGWFMVRARHRRRPRLDPPTSTA